MEEIRRTQERAATEVGVEKHEDGKPTRRHKISEGHVRICGDDLILID